MNQPPDWLWLLAAALALLWGWRLSRPRRLARRPPPPPVPTCVYRFYDPDGRLVYVGITNHLGRRLAQHNGDKPWWRSVATVTVTHYDDRVSAETAERMAIRREHPRHNIAHQRRRRRVYR